MTKKQSVSLSLTATDRRWVEQLEEWVEQVERLIGLVQGQQRLIGRQAEEARVELTAFKRDLRAEVKRVAGLRRKGELQGFADHSYAPAIEQAEAYFTIKANSVPGPAWFHALYDARLTLAHPLSFIRKKGKR